MWERGHLPCEEFDLELAELSSHERCTLARRRASMTQKQVASSVGCSRRWVNLMEKGVVPCDRLVKYFDELNFGMAW